MGKSHQAVTDFKLSARMKRKINRIIYDGTISEVNCVSNGCTGEYNVLAPYRYTHNDSLFYMV